MRSLSLPLGTLLFLFAASTAGCGYSSGVRLPEGHEKVGLEIFGNDSPVPDLERELHRTLSDQIAHMVSAPLIAPNRADLLVQGVVVDYRRVYGIISTTNELQETGVVITVRAWLYDPRRGVRLGETVLLDREVHYLVRVREEEAGARRLAFRTLSQELILDLFNQENYEPTGTGPPPEPVEIPEEPDVVIQ